MNKETQFTMPIWPVSVRTGRLGAVDWGALQASVMVSIVPCVLVYVLLQKYYVSRLPQRRGEVRPRQTRS